MFLKAIKANPNAASYHGNLGKRFSNSSQLYCLFASYSWWFKRKSNLLSLLPAEQMLFDFLVKLPAGEEQGTNPEKLSHDMTDQEGCTIQPRGSCTSVAVNWFIYAMLVTHNGAHQIRAAIYGYGAIHSISPIPVLLPGFAPAFGSRTGSYCATSQWETLTGNKGFNVVFPVTGKTAHYSTILLMKFLIDVPAVLYHRWGNLDLAKKHYEVSLKLDPMAPGTKENYNLLRRKLEQLQKKGGAWYFFSGCPCMPFTISVTWLLLTM